MAVSPPSAAAKKKALLEKQRSLFALAREMGFCLEKTCYYESELSSSRYGPPPPPPPNR